MHFGGRREVEAAADIVRDDYARLRRDRTGHFEALAIPARQRAGERLGTGRLNPKTHDQFATQIDRARGVEPSVRRRLLPERTREDHVFP